MNRELPIPANEQRALELLPWYVNGTLVGDEQEFVRQALRTNLTLRIEHDRLVRVRDLMREDDAEHAATDRAFDQLMSRIHRRRFWQGPGFWQAAATLAAVAVGLTLWSNAAPPPPRFETLTTPEPGAATAPRLRVVFADGVSEDARRALFASHGLTAGAPPTPEGVYTLVLPAGANARAIADALRADPRIAFASMPPASEQQ